MIYPKETISMKKAFLLFTLLSAGLVWAEDPAPVVAAAAEPAVAEPAASAEAPAVERPVPGKREMSPEMKEYFSRLDSIRKARDEQTQKSLQASKDIEARKVAMAAENKKVAKANAQIQELEEKLAKVRSELDAIYAADETLQNLEKAKADADAASAEKQKEMNSAVAAAMHARRERMGKGGEGHGSFVPRRPDGESVRRRPNVPLAPLPAPAEKPAE